MYLIRGQQFYLSIYKLNTEAKGSTGFRILKILIQNPEGEA